jgi:hypothetical protein
MTWRAFFKPGTILFLALWLVLLVGGQSRFFRDPGTFWHTVVGQQILTSRGFFDTDEFTFTFAGKTWIAHNWLGECTMAIVHGIDGFDSLLLATATLLASVFTWLGVRLMRCGLHPSLAMVVVALAVAASSGHFHVRTHLATIAGFAVMMAFFCDFEAGRIGLRRLAWLIPIFWVWCNMHGGALGGLATFAIAVAGWTLAWKIGWKSPVASYRQALLLCLIVFGCVATAFINPYGARLPETWLGIYGMRSLPRLIQEHAPIDFHDRNAWMILLFGAGYVGLLAATLPGKPRGVWLLPLIWFALACMRVRHAPLFAVSALAAIADLFPFTSIARHLEAQGSDLFETPDANPDPVPLREKAAGWAIPVGLVLLALSLQIARVQVPIIGHGWAQLDSEVWPVQLIDELKARQNERAGGTRIFNEYGYGGFLIYYARGFRVFVDDRCELFGDAWLSEFIDSEYLDPVDKVAEWQSRYGPFDYALVNVQPGPGFINYFEKNSEWELVGKTATAALYKHRNVN